MNDAVSNKAIPNPSEYAIKRSIPLYTVSCVEARTRIEARIGPTQGVQPTAKASPIMKEPK